MQLTDLLLDVIAIVWIHILLIADSWHPTLRPCNTSCTKDYQVAFSSSIFVVESLLAWLILADVRPDCCDDGRGSTISRSSKQLRDFKATQEKGETKMPTSWPVSRQQWSHQSKNKSKYEVMWNITIGKTVLSGGKKKKTTESINTQISQFFFFWVLISNRIVMTRRSVPK